jgi:hypothetical protein
MILKIDSIYYFDYTGQVGYYQSVRDFRSEEMTYMSLALSTPKISVNATPTTFKIGKTSSEKVREFIISHMDDLKEISELLAENSPKYIMICFADESRMYFEYDEKFCGVFSVINQYNQKDNVVSNNTTSPYAIHKDSNTQNNVYSNSVQNTEIQSPHSSNNRKKKKDPIWVRLVIGIVCFVAFCIIVAYAVSKPDDAKVVLPPSVNTTESEHTTENYLIQIEEPLNGEILSGYDDYEGSELTIKSSSNESYVVKLKDIYDEEVMCFYVRAGATVTVGVPAEEMYVYFASGDVWYGMNDLFGNETSYSMDDELKDFENYTYEYTLYPVSNGNFSETPIDAEDF